MSYKTLRWIVRLKKFSNKPWYFLLVSFLTMADVFVLFIPTDAILISSAMLKPKKWFRAAFYVTTASTFGAFLIAWLVQAHGVDFVQNYFGYSFESKTWMTTKELVDSYGFWALIFFALGPFPFHPAIIIASMAWMPLKWIFCSIWIGRGLKYFFFAWAATHAPRLLKKIWFVNKEVEEIEVKNFQDSNNIL